MDPLEVRVSDGELLAIMTEDRLLAEVFRKIPFDLDGDFIVALEAFIVAWLHALRRAVVEVPIGNWADLICVKTLFFPKNPTVFPLVRWRLNLSFHVPRNYRGDSLIVSLQDGEVAQDYESNPCEKLGNILQGWPFLEEHMRERVRVACL